MRRGTLTAFVLVTVCLLQGFALAEPKADGVRSMLGSIPLMMAVNCTEGETQACAVEGGTGEQACLTNGTFGACVATSCDDGYVLVNNSTCEAEQCTPGTLQNCTVENGSGNQTCSDEGQWESCEAVSCDEDYSLEDGECTAEEDDVIPYVNLVMLIMLVVLLAVICVAGIVAYLYFAKKERALMKEDMLLA